jgi:hypothetical protein
MEVAIASASPRRGSTVLRWHAELERETTEHVEVEASLRLSSGRASDRAGPGAEAEAGMLSAEGLDGAEMGYVENRYSKSGVGYSGDRYSSVKVVEDVTVSFSDEDDEDCDAANKSSDMSVTHSTAVTPGSRHAHLSLSRTTVTHSERRAVTPARTSTWTDDEETVTLADVDIDLSRDEARALRQQARALSRSPRPRVPVVEVVDDASAIPSDTADAAASASTSASASDTASASTSASASAAEHGEEEKARSAEVEVEDPAAVVPNAAKSSAKEDHEDAVPSSSTSTRRLLRRGSKTQTDAVPVRLTRARLRALEGE